MDSFGAIRQLARQKHALARAKISGDYDGETLLKEGCRLEDINLRKLAPEHPLLGGGVGALSRATKAIYLSSAVADADAHFVGAHELGHFWIETDIESVIVPAGATAGDPERPTPLGVRRVEAYSPQELRERHANVFAREFLLPREEARSRFIDKAQTAPEIARALRLPLNLVHQQLAVALLLPDIEAPKPKSSDRYPLDESQAAAAKHRGSPLLVEAGPGTGKTQTLIARVEFLIDARVPAASILALTFSNKAAHEIRQRVAAVDPTAGPEIWAGTFHAFGLEFLRKYGHHKGLRQPIRLLDQADVLTLLEENLRVLELDHYLRLSEPLDNLRHICTAISRAKDEVKSPEDYAGAAERMFQRATNEEDKLKALKAAEVARVYEHYQRLMREAGVVDFADLINLPIEILREHPEILNELRVQYREFLVDEYQDVNRASALLLKELAGDGATLWAVGDARQSIYRFRGAAPVNTQKWEDDYPGGQRTPLGVNYRSRQEIVDTFCHYAQEGMLIARGRPARLSANRGSTPGALDFNLAADRDCEVSGIAGAIQHCLAAGYDYRDQAVLCRGHNDLERIGAGLERAGIPVLYLGDLFERPEARDLLGLLSFVAEPHRGGLYRVACLPAYGMRLSDVRTFLAWALEKNITPLAALKQHATVPGLSDEGRASLSRLAADVADTRYRTGPGSFFADALFNKRNLIEPLLDGDDAQHQQRRLAVHQLLQFALENEFGSGDPKKSLLSWIRRLEVFGDERALREPPTSIDGINAVRLMTVHASKGLEFPVVHLPGLGAGMFPKKWSGQICPVPIELLSGGAPDAAHTEEEQCLFYVALSRARDSLSLSRPARTTATGSNASEALRNIARFLPRSPDGEITWRTEGTAPESAPDRADLSVPATEMSAADLDIYLRCPRRYLYQRVLGLSGARDDNAYVRFHRAVYAVLRWMNAQSDTLDADMMGAEFEKAWSTIGPHEHPLADLYKDAAQKIIRQAAARPRQNRDFDTELTINVNGCNLRVAVDEVEKRDTTVTVRRLRTGRAPKKIDQGVTNALISAAARDAFGPNTGFEVRYLAREETVTPRFDTVMPRRLQDVSEAIDGMRQGAFPAEPERSEDCPRCPHYFICPCVPSA